ncbi:MAG: hypothetical protein ABJ215_01770 [Alphaproteobacteria bacterium]
MKTLLTTAALAALLISGAALADGDSMKGPGMTGPHTQMQDGDGQHMGRGMGSEKERHSTASRSDHDKDHRGEGRHGESHEGQRHGDDDDHDGRHMKKMDRDHS